jgi:hypothetical protein
MSWVQSPPGYDFSSWFLSMFFYSPLRERYDLINKRFFTIYELKYSMMEYHQFKKVCGKIFL